MTRVGDNSGSSGGDIDALLDVFFKSELPRPWPTFQPPRGGTVLPLKHAKRQRFAFGRSRLALAASVLVLLLCGWLLSDKFPGSMSGTGFQPGAPTLDGPPGADRIRPFIFPSQDFLPDVKPASGLRKEKTKTKLSLEQDADGTGLRVEVEEISPRK